MSIESVSYFKPHSLSKVLFLFLSIFFFFHLLPVNHIFFFLSLFFLPLSLFFSFSHYFLSFFRYEMIYNIQPKSSKPNSLSDYHIYHYHCFHRYVPIKTIVTTGKPGNHQPNKSFGTNHTLIDRSVLPNFHVSTVVSISM